MSWDGAAHAQGLAWLVVGVQSVGFCVFCSAGVDCRLDWAARERGGLAHVRVRWMFRRLGPPPTPPHPAARQPRHVQQQGRHGLGACRRPRRRDVRRREGKGVRRRLSARGRSFTLHVANRLGAGDR